MKNMEREQIGKEKEGKRKEKKKGGNMKSILKEE